MATERVTASPPPGEWAAPPTARCSGRSAFSTTTSPAHDRRRTPLRHYAVQRPSTASPSRRWKAFARRRRAADLRHAHRVRRHHDGPPGHALQPRLARGHRRLHRDRVRRACTTASSPSAAATRTCRLLMAIARLNVPASSSTAAPSCPAAPPARTSHRLHLRGRRPVPGRQARQRRAPRGRVRGVPRRRARAAACTRPTRCRRAIEAMGMSLPRTPRWPPRPPRRPRARPSPARVLAEAIRAGSPPRSILTRKASRTPSRW